MQAGDCEICRIDSSRADCIDAVGNAICKAFESFVDESTRRIVIVCIGSDRYTGDCLGPLVGTFLGARERTAGLCGDQLEVLGCLDRPIHGGNLRGAVADALVHRHRSFVLAIDACLGSVASVGDVIVKRGPLRPGLVTGRRLPPIGDIHVVGVVNVAGFMEHAVLQTTRLSGVYRMAQVIADALDAALADYYRGSDRKRGSVIRLPRR